MFLTSVILVFISFSVWARPLPTGPSYEDTNGFQKLEYGYDADDINEGKSGHFSTSFQGFTSGGPSRAPDKLLTRYSPDGFADGTHYDQSGDSLADKNKKAISSDFDSASKEVSKKEKRDIDYRKTVMRFFGQGYFDGLENEAVVDRAYRVLVGIGGTEDDKKKLDAQAKRLADHHKLFKPISIDDLKLWDQGSNADTDKLAKRYEERCKQVYGDKAPDFCNVNEFLQAFKNMTNPRHWMGRCESFAAANSDPVVLNRMEYFNKEGSKVFLCQNR